MHEKRLITETETRTDPDAHPDESSAEEENETR